MVLKSRKQKLRLWQGRTPHIAAGKKLFLAILGVPWPAAAPTISISACRHVAFSGRVCAPTLLLFSEDTSHIGLGTHTTPHDLTLTNCIFSDPISTYGHLLKYWGLRLQHIFLGDTL